MVDQKRYEVANHPDDYWILENGKAQLWTRDHMRAEYNVLDLNGEVLREIGRKFSPYHTDACQALTADL